MVSMLPIELGALTELKCWGSLLRVEFGVLLRDYGSIEDYSIHASQASGVTYRLDGEDAGGNASACYKPELYFRNLGKWARLRTSWRYPPRQSRSMPNPCICVINDAEAKLFW
jgi:hypothetical protein